MFTKLFSSITTSSIWNEDNNTRIVWITMLAMAKKNGYVAASIGGLAHEARVTREACESALKILSSPDPDSRSREFEGRRVDIVDGGFQLLNHSKYRAMRSEEERKEYMKSYMSEYRRTKNVNKNVNNVSICKPPLAEAEAEAEEEAEKIARSSKPHKPTLNLADEEFIESLKALYPSVDMQRELNKMTAWLMTPRARGRKMTRQFVVNWLNRLDVPMDVKTSSRPISGSQAMEAL